ncbi:hypothetical protein HDV00_005287 [Rhizophlyctis rosea]|nr:hypothetical protein HDV00_005287 [Rhizophlyctis rosea]
MANSHPPTRPLASLPTHIIEDILYYASAQNDVGHMTLPPTVAKWWHSIWQRAVLRNLEGTILHDMDQCHTFYKMLTNNPHAYGYIKKAIILPRANPWRDNRKSWEIKIMNNELLLTTALHLKNMHNLREVTIGTYGGSEPTISHTTLALLLQSIPPSVAKIRIEAFFCDATRNLEVPHHICPILARAVQNMTCIRLTMKWLCPSFFESVDSFPNLQYLHVAVDAGYWYSCREKGIDGALQEGQEAFKRAGLRNLHKMPKLKVFVIIATGYGDYHMENALNGMVCDIDSFDWDWDVEWKRPDAKQRSISSEPVE